jgi:hypothetical protein
MRSTAECMEVEWMITAIDEVGRAAPPTALDVR